MTDTPFLIDAGPAASLRLSGRTLAVARSGWLAIALAVTVTYLVALPGHWDTFAHPSQTTLAHLTRLGVSPRLYATYWIAWETVMSAAYVIVGFIIFRRCGDERLPLFTALVLVVFGTADGTITTTVNTLIGHDWVLDQLLRTFEFIAWFGLGLFFYVFPSGRFVPGYARWFALAYLVVAVVWNLLPETPASPSTWPGWAFALLLAVMWGSWVFAQVYRYRKVSNSVERQQTKWVVFTALLVVGIMTLTSVVGVFVPGYALMSPEQPTIQGFLYMNAQAPLVLVMVAMPIAIAFSILRYRLWDIDDLIGRTLVYGTLSVFVVTSYALIVGLTGVLFRGSDNVLVPLVATGVIAVLFTPVRARLQRWVGRLTYGERDDPYGVLSRLSQRLESAVTPESVLPSIVEMVTQALKLTYAAIVLREGEAVEVAAAVGTPGAASVAFPLTYQHRFIGELRVAPRSANEPFTPAERRLLEDIAAHTGMAARNVRLTSDLQRSREQLVSAREEERRRLRRDLHDGLGPKLAGQTLKLEAALDSLDEETDTARELLQEAITESQAVITEIRRLVHGLRPPALDELGLYDALRELTAQFERGGFRVKVVLPESPSPLPAAVEVATYRIVQEAFTNVARHARARSCSVTVTVDDDLTLEVVDDGVGIPPERRTGVGLASMRERAEEIGGSCVIEAGESGGTRVSVRLPLGEP